MKKVIAYLVVFIIIIIEIMTHRSGYKFINTLSYFIVNGLLLITLIFLLKRELLSNLAVKIFLILIFCLGFMLSDKFHIEYNPSSGEALIIQENLAFDDYTYSFYKKKFIFFEEFIAPAAFISNEPLDISKSFDFIWIDDTTVKVIYLEYITPEEEIISLGDTFK